MEIVEGSELPVLVRTTDFPHWNRYAAVNDEFIPIHMDDEAGRKMGFAGAIGMGNLLWSYAHNLLRDWMGPNGRIERISAQYRAPNLRGHTIRIGGKVSKVVKAEGGLRATVDLSVDDVDGRQLMLGQATVFVAG